MLNAERAVIKNETGEEIKAKKTTDEEKNIIALSIALVSALPYSKCKNPMRMMHHAWGITRQT